MLNGIIRQVIGKSIVFYNPHRNTLPLLNEENKKRFFFINPLLLWKSTALFGRRSKTRYRVMSIFLSIINPVCIIEINWISKQCTLYHVWCKRNDRRFIVIQHGTYMGGIVGDKGHKKIKCNTFMVWSDFFKKQFQQLNSKKNFDCIVFGNPVYNQFNRGDFSYKQTLSNKILIAVSLVEGERLLMVRKFSQLLESFGFEVSIKEHRKQSVRSEPINSAAKFIEGVSLTTILKSQVFDVVVSDVSTAMNDIIFFKNRALFFSPPGENDSYVNNIYSFFMKNASLHIDEIKNKDDLLNFVDIERQEKLFNYLIGTDRKNNNLDFVEE